MSHSLVKVIKLWASLTQMKMKLHPNSQSVSDCVLEQQKTKYSDGYITGQMKIYVLYCLLHKFSKQVILNAQ